MEDDCGVAHGTGSRLDGRTHCRRIWIPRWSVGSKNELGGSYPTMAIDAIGDCLTIFDPTIVGWLYIHLELNLYFQAGQNERLRKVDETTTKLSSPSVSFQGRKPKAMLGDANHSSHAHKS